MVAKVKIVEHLGETALLLPHLIGQALAANDRSKVRMSALQAAAVRAFTPDARAIDLGAEAQAAALDAEDIRALVREAARREGQRFHSPGLAACLEGLSADVTAMLAAVEAGEVPEAAGLRARWTALQPDLAAPGGCLEQAAVARLTAVAPGARDTVHRLVMDLHKQLNHLAALHADEIVAGAHCSGLTEEDRGAVTAFMGGLERTRALKFDHPGLDTTAARSGGHLVIQNDIGTTDAHVLCISVTPERVSLTYTDVHRARAKFFVSLFDDVDGIAWREPEAEQVAGLADDAAFDLVTGVFPYTDTAARDAFLAAIGAALVFLIDWNKARKQLKLFVEKKDAIAILRWAARHGHGHRAFLELGGADLIDGAIQRTASAQIGYGVRLDHALGRETAMDFLRQVLRIAAEYRLAGRADRLVHDAVDTELAGRLERSGNSLLAGIVKQAGLARSIAAALLDTLAGAGTPARQAGETAKRIEEKADQLALELRAQSRRLHVDTGILGAIDAVEQAVDELEEAAFFLSVIPAATGGTVDGHLMELCRTAIRSTEAVARMADAASCVPDGHRVDVEDALSASAALSALEHEADAHERSAIAAALGEGALSARGIAAMECARRIEDATDRLAHAGHLLRNHVSGGLSQFGRRARIA